VTMMVDEEEDVEVKDEVDESDEQQDETPKKKIQKKKVVRRRKTKKERENPITVAVRLAVESGKVDFGARTGVWASLLGKAKLFVIANNAPIDARNKVVEYAKLSEIDLIEFSGSSMELGSVCGKPFPISILSVYDAGSSNIMEIAKKPK